MAFSRPRSGTMRKITSFFFACESRVFPFGLFLIARDTSWSAKRVYRSVDCFHSTFYSSDFWGCVHRVVLALETLKRSICSLSFGISLLESLDCGSLPSSARLVFQDRKPMSTSHRSSRRLLEVCLLLVLLPRAFCGLCITCLGLTQRSLRVMSASSTLSSCFD